MDLLAWTSAQVKQLLPELDGEYLNEAVKYSLSLSLDDTDRHWKSLLGSSPQVDSFLKELRSRRQSKQPSSQPPSQTKVLRITDKKPKRPAKVNKPDPVSVAVKENRPLTELEEIDSAIQSISLDKKRRECGCFGTKHEVFPLAPNCLNCGRIICAAEGIGTCFYCGEELVSEEQRQQVVRELRVERGVAKTKAANEKVRKVRAAESRNRAWASKVGGSDSESPYASGYATPEAYSEAEKWRDELLEFDRTYAERTRIIGNPLMSIINLDQQAEFTPQMTLTDKFSTPQERAAALRRLQQLEAEQAAGERAQHRRVLEIDFQTGKGTLRKARAEDLLDQSHETAFPKPTFVD